MGDDDDLRDDRRASILKPDAYKMIKRSAQDEVDDYLARHRGGGADR